MIRFTAALILPFALLTTLRSAIAQQACGDKALVLAGCWKVEPGKFAKTGKIGGDPGQTTLPPFIRLDTVPGRDFFDRPTGRRVRAIPLNSGTRYRDGNFGASPDSVHISWSNGYVWMSFRLPFDTLVMRGRAEAGTDYGGSEEAPVLIRRVECPPGSS